VRDPGRAHVPYPSMSPRKRFDHSLAAYAGALGLLALGIVTLAYRDTLLQWQPAQRSVSWRLPLALLSGVILLVAGIGIVLPRLRRRGAALACGWFALWVIALHVPSALTAASGARVAAWLGVAEVTAMATGFASLAVHGAAGFARRLLVAVFGLCAIVFGLSHVVYVDFTANMVPAWLPDRHLLAYATGAIHAATGLCMLLAVRVRLAIVIEAAMMTSFVALIHVPHVIATPGSRLELTALAIAWTLTSAAWLLAASIDGPMRLRR
jgi:uncharacterized membrane protein